MRASVAYRITYGFDAMISTAIHAAERPAIRRAANQSATAAPIIAQPDSDRAARSPDPNTPVQTCSST